MNPHLDEKWYQKLIGITSPIGETFNLLEPSEDLQEAQLKVFEGSGYLQSVPLFPDTVVMDPLNRPYEQLAKLYSEIDKTEINTVVRGVYLEYISDVRTNIELIQSACGQDASTYQRLNDQLYGRPDETIYQDVCDWIRHNVETTLQSNSDDELARRGKAVLKSIPVTNGSFERLLPSDETFKKVRDEHFKQDGFFDKLFGEEGLPEEPYITQQEGDEICQRVLRNIGADYEIVDAHNYIWSVSRQPSQLLRPVGYRLGRDEFIGIVAHEIGSHIYESVNGAKQPIQLFEMGLAGFVHGNEGRALLREQIVYEDMTTAATQPAWEYSVLKFLAISLAVGYHKGRRYDMPELYKVMYELYYLWRLRRYPYDTNIELFSRRAAWLVTVRLLKGTNGTGGCYQKDYVYLEGNVKLWQLAKNDPGIIMMGDKGKFNLLDAAQRDLISNSIFSQSEIKEGF